MPLVSAGVVSRGRDGKQPFPMAKKKDAKLREVLLTESLGGWCKLRESRVKPKELSRREKRDRGVDSGRAETHKDGNSAMSRTRLNEVAQPM